MLGKRFNKIVGDSGEAIAINYLKKHKYKIIETNYKHKIGEIDVIAKKNNVLIFVEVKYRSSDYFGLPREAVNEYKQNKIRLIATAYIKQKRLFDNPCRFDVIEILDGKITHIEDCF